MYVFFVDGVMRAIARCVKFGIDGNPIGILMIFLDTNECRCMHARGSISKSVFKES